MKNNNTKNKIIFNTNYKVYYVISFKLELFAIFSIRIVSLSPMKNTNKKKTIFVLHTIMRSLTNSPITIKRMHLTFHVRFGATASRFFIARFAICKRYQSQ